MEHHRRARKSYAAIVVLLCSSWAQAQTAEPSWTASISPTQEEVLPQGVGPQTLQFGEAVAADGSTVLAAMPAISNARGRVAVFTRQPNGEWLRTGTLEASDAEDGDAFGQALAVRERLALAASASAVYVFRFSAGAWTQVQRLPVDAGEWFNATLDYEQQSLVVGAGSADAPGSVYLYSLDPRGQFQRRRKLSAPTGSVDEGFGASVAVWHDTVVVGAPGYNGKGAAYVYSFSNAQRLPQVLNASGTASGGFGAAVDAGCSTIVVGAPGEDPVFPSSTADYVAGGAAYVFKQQGGTWAQSQRLRPADGGWFLNFGWNVQLSGDRIAVAAPWNWTRYDSAYVVLYERTGRQFAPIAYLSGDPSLGVGLALTSTRLVAGVPWDPLYSIGYGLISEFQSAP